MLGETLAAWIGLPAVAVASGLGLALLLERATRHDLGVMRVPVGLCVAICLTLAALWVDAPGFVAAALVAVPAAAGLVLGRRELARYRPGWFTLAWLAAFGLHLAPVVLAGEWTWTGYNFVNDTAQQLLLADYLADNGVATPGMERTSAATEFVRAYLDTGYPIGSHALLGTLGELVPAPLPALYQPCIAVLAASAALSLASIARQIGLPAPAAAGCGALAVGANLFYQYALQGNIKEIAFFMALATAAGVGGQLIASDRPLRAVPATAFGFAAAFSVYSAAAAPYLLGLGAALAVAALWLPDRASLPRLLTAGAALLAAALVLAAPALSGAMTFRDVAAGTFSGDAGTADLGQLLRPLKLEQAAGVWLSGDYRLAVPPGRELLTAAFCVVIAALLVLGIVWMLRRKQPAGLLLLVATLLSAMYLLPRLSPYADGKVLALASPIALLGAGIGAWSVARFSQVAAAVLAGLVAVGVLWSDAYAYHAVRLAPTERLEALEDVGERLRDTPGLIMVNEPEEFAKVFRGGARFNSQVEAFTPKQIELRTPQSFFSLHFDLDQQVLDYVEQFPTIVKRRAPDASRPPANYRLAFANDWYEVWRREPGPEVIEHLPLQAVHRAAVPPRCSDVRALAGRARDGDVLVAARPAPVALFDTVEAQRSPSWVPHPTQPGMVVTVTPGRAEGTLDVSRAGSYRMWVAGSQGRTVEVEIDGRTVGAARGVNNLGQWLPAGEVTLDAGSHEVALTRAGGDLRPGDGYVGELGPLALQPSGSEPELERFQPGEAERLCGREWDWIELVRP
jgi:hypothetical protein